LKDALKGLGVAAGVAGGVIAAGTAIWKTAVAPIIDYNKAILDAARSTRMGTEDFSRFVQVGDDMGVSMDSITRALQMATKNGFAPSISAIADLADKANAMNTPTERAAALAKMFGRNWAELDPILQLGGQRIRELAEAQADGLVVTEEEIKKTEELRLAVDELGDSVKATMNEIGLGIADTLLGGKHDAENFSDQWTLALQLVKNQGVEPTKKAIDAMYRSLAHTEGLNQAHAIRDTLDDIRSKDVLVDITEITHHIDDWSGDWAAPSGMPGINPGLTLTQQRAYQEQQQGPLEGASGLDFVVPPGYPNDSFPMRVQSGEHVQVTPAGEKSKSNVTINVSSTPMDVQWITRQLKAAVGM
jgi:hypothetical protein